MRISDYMQREDLSGDMATLADELGIDTVRCLYESWRGCVLNVPSRMPKRTMKRYISNAVELGQSVRDMARELNVSERYVQRLLRTVGNPRQMELFPEGDNL